jgi:hypothetical protein
LPREVDGKVDFGTKKRGKKIGMKKVLDGSDRDELEHKFNKK